MALLGTLIPSLISAGGSLLSGIFGDKAATKQNRAQMAAIKDQNAYIKRFNKQQMEREDNRIQRLVVDARAAGIHPLAALGAGGGGSGSFAMPEAVYGGAPVTGSAVGDAIKAFGDTLPMVNEQGALQTELLRAQIRNVDASTANLIAEARRTTMSSAVKAASNTSFADVKLQEQPDTSTAQEVQDRYGDIIENIFGIAKLGRDVVASEFWDRPMPKIRSKGTY